MPASFVAYRGSAAVAVVISLSAAFLFLSEASREAKRSNARELVKAWVRLPIRCVASLLIVKN